MSASGPRGIAEVSIMLGTYSRDTKQRILADIIKLMVTSSADKAAKSTMRLYQGYSPLWALFGYKKDDSDSETKLRNAVKSLVEEHKGNPLQDLDTNLLTWVNAFSKRDYPDIKETSISVELRTSFERLFKLTTGQDMPSSYQEMLDKVKTRPIVLDTLPTIVTKTIVDNTAVENITDVTNNLVANIRSWLELIGNNEIDETLDAMKMDTGTLIAVYNDKVKP